MRHFNKDGYTFDRGFHKPAPDSVLVGLQRKVEEQRKEIVRLKTGLPQANEITRLKAEMRASRESYDGLQATYYEALKELAEAKQQ